MAAGDHRRVRSSSPSRPSQPPRRGPASAWRHALQPQFSSPRRASCAAIATHPAEIGVVHLDPPRKRRLPLAIDRHDLYGPGRFSTDEMVLRRSSSAQSVSGSLVAYRAVVTVRAMSLLASGCIDQSPQVSRQHAMPAKQGREAVRAGQRDTGPLNDRRSRKLEHHSSNIFERYTSSDGVIKTERPMRARSGRLQDRAQANIRVIARTPNIRDCADMSSRIFTYLRGSTRNIFRTAFVKPAWSIKRPPGSRARCVRALMASRCGGRRVAKAHRRWRWSAPASHPRYRPRRSP